MEIRVREVAVDLHTALKITCVAKGITLNEGIKDALEQWVRKQGLAGLKPQKDER